MNTVSTMRPLVFAIALVCTSASSAMSMQDLFDSVNAQGNVSSPAAMQAQTMNMYSGGSMFMRTPVRTYNIASFTPPSWNAGCGGIDLFAGGFSFINKEQFVALLRNIGSNALAYGFKLAIQNLCPTCDGVMQALQATAQAINRQNIDSCEAAKGIVHSVIPDTWTRDTQNSAKNYGVDSNLFSDITDAWTNVMNSQNRAVQTNQQVATGKPELKDALPVGNVTWNALRKLDGVTNEYRMILMSMIGTTIWPANTENPVPKVLARKEISIETFIGGNRVNAEGLPLGEIDIPIWRCSDVQDCLDVTEDVIRVPSFKSMIRTKLQEITDKIATRSGHSDVDGLHRFLNATDLPVYKMIAVATSLDNTAMADSLINRYQELIAAKYAEVYIKRAVRDLRASMSKYSVQASTTMSATMDELRPQMDRLEEESREVLARAYTQTISTYNIAQEVAHIERAMTSNLSQTLRASLTFGKSLR